MTPIVDVHSHVLLRPGPLPPEVGSDITVLGDPVGDGRTVLTRKGISLIRYPEFGDTDAQDAVCRAAGITTRLISPAMQLNTWVETLTSAPSVELAALMNDTNVELAKRYPGAIRPLATINPLEPKENLPELDRCLDELGMPGLVVEPSWMGRFLDEPDFFEFWAHIEARDVPVFMHPPMIPLCHLKMNAYKLEETVGRPCETALCVARMICSGLFDRFPGLRIVLAHMGGALMPVVGRIDMGYRLGYEGLPAGEAATCELMPSEYLRRNLSVDTMGFSAATVRQAIEVFGVDRVMFGSDYAAVPIDPAEHVSLLDSLELTADQREKVLWRNADQFFGLGLAEAQT
jgi:aminocarboxymuconate-semialdehyde decarboxylase